MKIITRLEEAVFIAIWRLDDDAYGVTINKEVSKRVKKRYSMGAMYFLLDQILRKGFVSKQLVNLYREKGGRSLDIVRFFVFFTVFFYSINRIKEYGSILQYESVNFLQIIFFHVIMRYFISYLAYLNKL